MATKPESDSDSSHGTLDIAGSGSADPVTPALVPEKGATTDAEAHEQTADQALVDIEYRVYPQRWYALFSLFTLSVSLSLNWNTFSPVSARAAEYYETTVAVINWFSLVIYVTSVATGLISAFVIDSRGIRVALIAGASFNVVGTWVRYVGVYSPDKHTALVVGLLGQTILGIGRPFVMSCSTRLAVQWFSMKERTLANTLGAVSPSLGVLLSSAVTSYIISTPDRVPVALLAWACYSVVPFFCVMFVSDKPPTPPSPSAAVMGATRTGSFAKWKKSFVTAFTNKDYIMLWLLMSGQLSIFLIYIVLISSIMLPYGYSSQQVGFVTVAIIIAGWLALPVSKIVDKTGGWVLAMRWLLVLTTVSLAGLTLSLRPDLYWSILLCAAVFGFVNFPILAIVFELAMEATYPDLLPAMSSYLIFALGQIIGIVLTPVLTNVGNKIVILWVLTGISGLTAIIGLLYRGKTKRVNHETTVLDQQKMAKALKAAQAEAGVAGKDVGDGKDGEIELETSGTIGTEQAKVA